LQPEAPPAGGYCRLLVLTLAMEQAASLEDWDQFYSLLDEREAELNRPGPPLSAPTLTQMGESNLRMMHSLRSAQTKMAEEFRSASGAIRARGQYRAAGRPSVAIEI
jgi:hypothetical protein